MGITLGQGIALIFIFIIGIVIFVLACNDYAEPPALIAIAAVTLLVVFGFFGAFRWYNSSTASGIRNYKDFQSELNNGIEREITITAEDGREIFHYEGKIDIEANHEDNYIKFESEDGRRYIIYYGIQDTILIIEK